MVWYGNYYGMVWHAFHMQTCFLRPTFLGFSSPVFVAVRIKHRDHIKSEGGAVFVATTILPFSIFSMRLFSKSISIALLMSSSSNSSTKNNFSLPYATALAAAQKGDAAAADHGNEESSAASSSSIPQLPPSTGNDPTIPSIKLGETIRFEEFGPIILNTDGTTRRISNWDTLTQQEQAATWRRISKRNEERRLVLLEQMKQQQQQQQADETGEENDKEQEL